MNYEDDVKNHYRGQVERVGLSSESTMPDHVVRDREIEAILYSLSLLGDKNINILEIGCGNGVLLDILHKNGYKNCVGIDFLEEFVGLARSRKLPFKIELGDIRSLKFQDESFDVVISERVIINLKDKAHQFQAFGEIRRVLRSSGHLVLFEAYEDALDNINEARSEFGLKPIPMAGQNRWFKPGELDEFISGRFQKINEIGGVLLPSENLLSSHYFISRVIHAFLIEMSGQDVVKERNSHFSKFFGGILPPHGNYSPVKYSCLQCV